MFWYPEMKAIVTLGKLQRDQRIPCRNALDWRHMGLRCGDACRRPGTNRLRRGACRSAGSSKDSSRLDLDVGTDCQGHDLQSLVSDR